METIQFIAHHDLQAQSFLGILPFLKEHRCIVSVGQNVLIDPAATIVVVADHLAFQCNIKKNSKYKLVHISHDLADLDIYRTEHKHIKDFDLVLCPSFSHYEICQSLFPQVAAYPVGWAKSESDDKQPIGGQIFPDKDKTIIFAPTEIADLNWRRFVDVFENSKYQVLIKNHVYWNYEEGNEPPLGQEIRYNHHKTALLELEEYLISHNLLHMELVDRKSNISDIFSRAKFLLTDSSSAALEFAGNGFALEFGLFDSALGVRVPDVSLVDNQVLFIDEEELLTVLKAGELEEFSKSLIGSQKVGSKLQILQDLSLPVDAISAFLIVFSKKRKVSEFKKWSSSARNLYRLIRKSLRLRLRIFQHPNHFEAK